MISIDEATKTITVEQAELTPVSGSLYEFKTNDYRLAVGALLDDERYIWMDAAFIHNTEVTVAGTTFARTIQQVNGYMLQFENTAMTVLYSGSNNNLFDSENGILVNSALVNVIGNNSAGLQTVVSGSGLSAAEQVKLDDLHKIQGLKSGTPMTVTPTSRVAGDISQTLTGDGTTTKTVTRQ